jgi:hypothetical protein
MGWIIGPGSFIPPMWIRPMNILALYVKQTSPGGVPELREGPLFYV